MKRPVALLLVLLMVLSPACTAAPAETEPAEAPSVEAPAATAAEAPSENPILAVVLPALVHPLHPAVHTGLTDQVRAEHPRPGGQR